MAATGAAPPASERDKNGASFLCARPRWLSQRCAVLSDDDGFLAPHPARNARARRRVWRPCPPPGKRRRRLNAPYAGSPSPLQRFVECAYRRRVHLRLRCPSLRRFPANRRLGSSAVGGACRRRVLPGAQSWRGARCACPSVQLERWLDWQPVTCKSYAIIAARSSEATCLGTAMRPRRTVAALVAATA